MYRLRGILTAIIYSVVYIAAILSVLVAFFGENKKNIEYHAETYLTDLYFFFMQLVHRATAAMIGALAALSFLALLNKVNLPDFCNYLCYDGTMMYLNILHNNFLPYLITFINFNKPSVALTSCYNYMNKHIF